MQFFSETEFMLNIKARQLCFILACNLLPFYLFFFTSILVAAFRLHLLAPCLTSRRCELWVMPCGYSVQEWEVLESLHEGVKISKGTELTVDRLTGDRA